MADNINRVFNRIQVLVRPALTTLLRAIAGYVRLVPRRVEVSHSILIPFVISTVQLHARRLFGGQLSREPAIHPKVHHQLPQRARRNRDALGAQHGGLVRGAGGVAAVRHMHVRPAAEGDESRGGLYRGEMTPLALMTRCQGTVWPLKRAAGSAGRCLRQTPTWRGRCAGRRVRLLFCANCSCGLLPSLLQSSAHD